MARSRYVYVVQSSGTEVIATFTVRRECVSYLYGETENSPYSVTTVRDNDKIIGIVSAWRFVNARI